MGEIVQLCRDGATVVIELGDGVPAIRHWGVPVTVDASALATALERPTVWGALDVEAPACLLPEHGAGWPGRPGLAGHRDTGDGWAPRFTTQSVQCSATALTWSGADAVAGLEAQLTLKILPGGLVSARAAVTNTGGDAYQLDDVSLTFPVPDRAREVATVGGRWAGEFGLHRAPWLRGARGVENRRGRTSHQDQPVIAVGTEGFSEEVGEVWMVHVAWSGNHKLHADALADGRRCLQAGELLMPGEIRLQPGESYATPDVVAAYSCIGLNGISDAFHGYLRSRAHHPRTARPVILNTWEAVYFDHDLATLRRLADRAAHVGVERFVLDDGWFNSRRHDRAGLGDWWVDPVVWPDGLRPLVDHVRGLGMEMGIWVEPEMVNPDSDMYRDHPDWVLGDERYPMVLGRHQLVLDLARADVRDHLFARLDAVVCENDIAYLKWDMNRDVVGATHNGRAGVHAQVLGVYALMDRLRAAHPGVEIETCASGGGRVDMGILHRSERAWASDNNDALDRQRIQRGFSYLYPPELMGAHIGAPTAHITARRHGFAFRAGTAFFGHLGIEWNLLQATDQDLSDLAGVVSLHKRFRALLHTGRVLRIDHPDAAVIAHAVVARDAREALVSHAQIDAPASLPVGPVRVPGLAPATTYRVGLLALARARLGAARSQPRWLADGAEMSGQALAVIGLPPPVLTPGSLVLVHVGAIG